MVGQGIAFGLAIYIARTVGAYGFGLWVFASTMIAYLSIVIDGGTETWGMRELGAHPERLRQALSGVIRLRLILCGGTLVVVAIAALFIPLEQEIALLLGTLSLLAIVFNTNWAHRGLEHAAPALTTLIQRLLMAALVVAMVRTPADAVRVTLWQGLSEAIAAIILFLMLAPRIKAAPAAVAAPHRRLFAESWPLGVSRALRNLTTAGGAIVLGFSWSTEDVGYFGAALRIATVIVLISSIFNNAAFPALTRASNSKDENEQLSITAAARLLALMVTPVVVGGVVLSAPLIQELFSPGFAPAALSLAVLLCALWCMAQGDLMRRILAARHQQRLDLRLTAQATAVAMIATVVLTPLFGAPGAASAMLIGELALLILAKRALGQTGPRFSIISASAVPFAAALAMAAGVMLLDGHSVWVRLAAGAAIYVGLMWFMRRHVLDDLHNLSFLARRAPFSTIDK